LVKARNLKLKNEVRLVVVLTVCLGVLLLVGLSIALQEPLYVSQSSLSTTYNTPFANRDWKGVYFNDSQGRNLAVFYFSFRSLNQSLGPVLTTLSFGPTFSPQFVDLDSAKFTFATPSPGWWPDIGYRVPTNGLNPTQISEANGKVTLNFQNLGFYGTGTETFDIWFGINAAGYNTDHSVFLTVDITAHTPNSVLVGHSYSGEANFQIVAQPNGLLTVSDTIH
jgi:hypothetical protein